jgi:hypothetical protein
MALRQPVAVSFCAYRADTPAELRMSDAICTGPVDELPGILRRLAAWSCLSSPRTSTVQRDHRPDRRRRQRPLAALSHSKWRALLQSGRPLVRALPWRLGLELSAVIAGGTRILDRIAAVGGDVFAHRPVLRTWDWCTVAYHALVPTRASAGNVVQ